MKCIIWQKYTQIVLDNMKKLDYNKAKQFLNCNVKEPLNK